MTLRGAPVVALCVVLAAIDFDASAQGAPLDAPMHPIDKTAGTPPSCLKCPPPGAKDAEQENVTDRSAPEYAGARRESGELQPTEVLTGDLVGTAATLPVPLQIR